MGLWRCDKPSFKSCLQSKSFESCILTKWYTSHATSYYIETLKNYSFNEIRYVSYIFVTSVQVTNPVWVSPACFKISWFFPILVFSTPRLILAYTKLVLYISNHYISKSVSERRRRKPKCKENFTKCERSKREQFFKGKNKTANNTLFFFKIIDPQ